MFDALIDLHQYRGIAQAQAAAQSAADKAENIGDRIRDLEKRLDLVVLVNQALAEIVAERHGLSEADLLAKIEEIDLRDGVRDGRIGNALAKCGQCQRAYNHRLNRCLYCGHVNPGTSAIVNNYQTSPGLTKTPKT